MEMVLNNGFCDISQNEINQINGGGWLAALSAFGGGVLVAFTPVGCLLGGPGVGAGMLATGCAALDFACDNPNK